MDGPIAAILSGPGGVLFGDLAVHEHDLRSAVGSADHGALEVEVMLPRTLAGLAKPLRQAGLAQTPNPKPQTPNPKPHLTKLIQLH